MRTGQVRIGFRPGRAGVGSGRSGGARRVEGRRLDEVGPRVERRRQPEVAARLVGPAGALGACGRARSARRRCRARAPGPSGTPAPPGAVGLRAKKARARSSRAAVFSGCAAINCVEQLHRTARIACGEQLLGSAEVDDVGLGGGLGQGGCLLTGAGVTVAVSGRGNTRSLLPIPSRHGTHARSHRSGLGRPGHVVPVGGV